MNFHELSLSPAIQQAIDELKYTTPTEIQAKAIPVLLKDSSCHLMAQAKTGTGKTVAYAIPLAEKLEPTLYEVQAVVIVPTRELCKQVYEVLTNLTKYRRMKTVEVYGGVSISAQIKKIEDGAQIIIATPGRLIDLYKRHVVSFAAVKYIVLDEADQMLDMGFMPDIEFLVNNAMKRIHPRFLLFSATMKEGIQQIAQKFLRDGKVLQLNVSHDTLTVEHCNQIYFMIPNADSKFPAFMHVYRRENPKKAIIFTNTRNAAKKLIKKLGNKENLVGRPDIINGDMSQAAREKVTKAFRDNKINCLIATDVAARGLDFSDVSHVFNYDVPSFAEDYVHRIGRTSRMEKQGTAVSFCVRGQEKMLKRIEQFTRTKLSRESIPGIAEILEQTDDDLELEDVRDRGPCRKRNDRRRGHKGAGNSKRFQKRELVEFEETDSMVPLEQEKTAEAVEMKEYMVSAESIQEDKNIRKTTKSLRKMEISLRTELSDPSESFEHRRKTEPRAKSERRGRNTRSSGNNHHVRGKQGHREQKSRNGDHIHSTHKPRVHHEHSDHSKRNEKKTSGPRINSTPKRRREAMAN